MSPTPTPTPPAERPLVELDARTGDGLTVTLLWNPDTNATSVHVIDLRGGAAFTVPTRGHDARDVFLHPYAYAPAAR